MKKTAIVTPWFGMDIQGGAEAEARALALHLSDAGLDTEILTTCVRSFNSDWNVNYYKEKEYTESGLTVRRYKADRRNTVAFDAVNAKLMNGIAITRDEEDIFLKNMVNSSSLYRYIKEHAGDYAVFIFIPYMFGTTYYGCQICPEKSVLIPCFHDESYFYLKSFKDVFSKVAGIVYNASPEMELTVKNYPIADTVKQIVMGIGMDTDKQGDESRFRDKFGINDPFILYAGRKDKGKNVDTLLQYFAEYKKRNHEQNGIRLVMIGGGSIEIPGSVTESVTDLGFVDIQDKYDAYASAYVLCQPSQHESFSYVIMESWLEERPVMVADQCEVTKSFCRESNGGLWFRDYFEFEAVLNYLLGNKNAADSMGVSGRAFVTNRFAWDIIVKEYMKLIEELDR